MPGKLWGMTDTPGRRFEVDFTAEIGFTVDAVDNKMDQQARTEGLRSSRGDSRVSRADSTASGQASDEIRGRPSGKRDSELRAAQLLVERLNADGGHWGTPTTWPANAPEQGVDCIALDGHGDELKIQVTTPETEAWRLLGAEGGPASVARTVTTDDLVKALHDAIQRKHLKAYPDIILVLDATDSVGFALATVVDAFRARYGAWAKGNFASVWLAGPVVDTVSRLDQTHLAG